MFSKETTVQALAYLVRNSGQGLSKLVLLKLVYLADRYHLRKYGRTILGDRYFAMQYGPVASKTKNVIEGGLRDEYAARYVRVDMIPHKPRGFQFVSAVGNEPLDWISETEAEALDAALKIWRTCDNLVGFTHEFPEWKKHEGALKRGETSVAMDYADFFEPGGDCEYCEAPAELVRMSKEEYLERKDILDALNGGAMRSAKEQLTAWNDAFGEY